MRCLDELRTPGDSLGSPMGLDEMLDVMAFRRGKVRMHGEPRLIGTRSLLLQVLLFLEHGSPFPLFLGQAYSSAFPVDWWGHEFLPVGT